MRVEKRLAESLAAAWFVDVLDCGPMLDKFEFWVVAPKPYVPAPKPPHSEDREGIR